MFRLIMAILTLWLTLAAGVPEVLILPNNGAWVTLKEEPFQISDRLFLYTYGLNIFPETVWNSPDNEGILRYSYPRYGLFDLETGTEIHVVLKESLDIRGTFLKFDNNTLFLEKEKSVILVDASNVMYFEIPEIPQDKTLEFFPPPASSKKRIVPVNYGFRTGDLAWSAEYELRWKNEDKAVFSPWFRLMNRGTGTLNNVKVTLLAGDVKTSQVSRDAAMRTPKGMGVSYAAETVSAADTPQSSGENYIFKLKDFVTFLPRTEFRQALSDPSEIAPDKKIIVKGNSFSSSGNLPVHGDLELTFSIKKTGKDDLVLPEGLLRIFDENGIFGGEVFIPNTPSGEPIVVTPGKAFDLVFERTIVDYKRERDTAEGIIRYEIRNQSKRTLPVIIRDTWHGNWTVKNSTHKTDKKSSSELEIPLSLKVGEKVVVEYSCYVSYR